MITNKQLDMTTIVEIREIEGYPTQVNELLARGWKLLFIGQWAERVGSPDGSFQSASIVYIVGRPMEVSA